MVGQTLAHYRVLEKIGQSGMGEVYLAEVAKLEPRVANWRMEPIVGSNRITVRRRFI